MSSTDTIDDLERIRTYGMMLIRTDVSLCLESILWGFYLLLFCEALFIQWKRGFRKLGTKVMLFVNVFLFTTSTTLLALNLTGAIMQIKYPMVVIDPNLSWTERIEGMYPIVMPLGVPMETLFLFNMLIGDAMVIFRAKLIWGSGWMIVIFPLVFLITALGFTLTSVVCISSTIKSQNQTSLISGSYVCRRAEPISWALSILTNLACTLLIAYLAWAHRKDLAGINRSYRSSSGVERVLNLLVDSGFIYLLFLLTQVTLFLENGDYEALNWTYAILAPFGDQISGIYSTSIIVLVASQDLIGDHGQGTDVPHSSLEKKRNNEKTLTQIEFGLPSTSSSTGSA